MRRWGLAIALLLSVGINVGILSVLAVHRLRPARPPRLELPARPGPRLAALADRMGLEGERRERFLELQLRLLQRTRENQARLTMLRRELRRELVAPEPDPERARRLAAALGTAYQTLEGDLARAVLETRELLDGREERLYLDFVARLRADRLAPGPGRRRPLREAGPPPL